MADEALFIETAGSAIAGFTLGQLAFWAVLKSGLLSKGEAEEMLRQAVAANKVGGPANANAGAKLEAVLKAVSAYEPKPRQ
jgi:hypothetical protein